VYQRNSGFKKQNKNEVVSALILRKEEEEKEFQVGYLHFKFIRQFLQY
jgi:hypothetical protein